MGKIIVARTRSILCFGDSNTYGAVPTLARNGRHRFAPDRRWPGVMRRQLGAGWEIVEAGQPSRTTLRDDQIEGAHKNGAMALPICLESHMPLDAVILMLGTNDLKQRFGASASDIADSVEVLIRLTQRSEAGPAGSAPAVILVTPPALSEVDWLGEMFRGGAAKSRLLPPLYAAVAKRTGAALVDASVMVEPSVIDGIHLESDAHRCLGTEIARVVKELLS